MANQQPPSQPPQKEDRLGQLEPMHRFFLNPYPDVRFTKCPLCDQMMKSRKKPFLIHIDPNVLLTFNITGKYCPTDDLLILHQDRLESMMTTSLMQHDHTLIGHDYLVIGTIERDYWQERVQGKGDDQDMFDHLHDFIEYVHIEPARWTWGPAGSEENE